MPCPAKPLLSLGGLALLASLAPVAAPGVSRPPPDVPELDWQRVADAAPEDAPTALGADGAGTLALGGARGVRLLVKEGVPEAVLRRGPVVDLAFLDDGSLLVATGQGLYRVGRDGGSSREDLAVELASGGVTRLDAARGLAVAATGRGVFLRDAQGRWERVRRLPQAPADVVALRDLASDLELWSVIDGELWIAGLRPGSTDPWLFAKRARLPLAPGSEPAEDLAFDLPGADSVLVYPTQLAVRDEEGVWRILRPALPPGARARRIAHAFGRLWLATDAGLLSAPHIEGPWERAASPVGSLPVIGLLGGRRLSAATHRGLHVARIARPMAGPPGEFSPRPDVHALHVAALRHQGLRSELLHSMRSRAERRGWWPELDVTLFYDEQRDRGRDSDQTFVSGETRYLYDGADDSGRDFGVRLNLSWDLGDAVFHPEEIDVSREARSVITLRDDVLDEVTQLFFERERVLARLELAPAAERHVLALRAAELAAGLDAWTGGAFSRAMP